MEAFESFAALALETENLVAAVFGSATGFDLTTFRLTVRPNGADRPWKEDPPM